MYAHMGDRDFHPYYIPRARISARCKLWLHLQQLKPLRQQTLRLLRFSSRDQEALAEVMHDYTESDDLDEDSFTEGQDGTFTVGIHFHYSSKNSSLVIIISIIIISIE